MKEAIDRISQHQAFSELRAFEAAIEASREAGQVDPTAFDSWQRIERVAKYVGFYLGAIDPALVPLVQLDGMASQLQAARSQVDAFTQSRNVNHISATNTHLDQILVCLANIPVLAGGDAATELVAAASTYRRSVDDLVRTFEDRLRALTSDHDSLENRLQEVTALISTEKGRVDSFATQFQQQFSAAQDARQTEFQTAEGKRMEEGRSALSQTVAEATDSRLKAIESFKEMQGAAEQEHANACGLLQSSGAALLEKLESFRGQAERVVGIISTTGMVHGFQKTANDERSAARLWKFIAAASLITWIGVGLYFFWLTYDKELTWTAVVRQLLISTPFVLLAGFAALQVAKHQRAEKSNRQAELEIASLDPYLASMDDPTRNEVKKAMVEKFFGQRDAEHPKESKQILEMVTEMAKVIQQLQQQILKK